MNEQTYDYRGKMRENREQWRTVGVVNTTVTIPEKHKTYIAAVSTMMCAEALLEAIEAHDQEAMTAFANRQPRLPFSYEDAVNFKHRLESASSPNERLIEDIDRVFQVLYERKEAIEQGKVAMQEGDEVKATYFLAREYALTYYLRGAYNLVRLKAEGRVPNVRGV